PRPSLWPATPPSGLATPSSSSTGRRGVGETCGTSTPPTDHRPPPPPPPPVLFVGSHPQRCEPTNRTGVGPSLRAMVEHRRSRFDAAPVRPARAAVALAVFVALAFIAGCSSDSDGSAPTTNASAAASTDAGTSRVSGSIIVSAAASLTDAFTTIRDQFVAANPDAHVTLNFGSSGALSTQILNGAPADVAAFADTAPMNALADADLLAAPPKVFARNRLVIVTEPGNPNGIDSLADLATAGTVSLCVDTAPCGKFADRILAEAGVTIPTSNITRGTDVRSTLTAVTEGDAVAAIVYVSD